MTHGWRWVDGLHFIFFPDSKEISHSHLPAPKEHQYFLNSSLDSSCFSPAWRIEPPALPTVEYYRERHYVSLRKEELRSVQQKGTALNRPLLLPVGEPALLQLQPAVEINYLLWFGAGSKRERGFFFFFSFL